MFFRIISYLKFLAKSTNQHGVHSPFVYNMVTLCFYDKKKKKSDPALRSILKKTKKHYLNIKTARLLNSIVSYLNYTKGFVPNVISKEVIAILNKNNPITISNTIQKSETYDIIYTDLNYQKIDEILQLFTLTHNDSLLIINNIYNSSENLNSWKTIITNSNARVTINTYSLGFIFFRKEQVKEHFVIRV